MNKRENIEALCADDFAALRGAISPAVRRAVAAGFRSDFTTPAGMREHGWTGAAIQKFLGEPDRLAINNHYRSGPRVRLYEVKRVLKVQQSKAFQSWLKAKEASSPIRKQAALKVAAAKRAQTLQYVMDLHIEVPVHADRTVLELACEHYNGRGQERLSDNYAAVPDVSQLDDVEEFYQRITVNYLRHVLTNYELELARLHGRTGVDYAVYLLRERIYAAIGDAYPALSCECYRQEYERRM